MNYYTLPIWVAFFLIYCFVGWIIETTYVSLAQKRFVNRGFMRGPFLPLYGFGALTILISCKPVADKPYLVFLLGMLGATVLEYITGLLMETLFKTKYWDYSNQRLNYKGRICLSSSLAWGALSLLMIYCIHGPVQELVFKIPEKKLVIADIVIICIELMDFALAFHIALNLNTVLEKLTALKGELDSLREQLNEEMRQSERGLALIEKIEELRAERIELIHKMRFYVRDFVRAHPTASSKRFNDALIEVKQRIRNRKNSSDED